MYRFFIKFKQICKSGCKFQSFFSIRNGFLHKLIPNVQNQSPKSHIFNIY